MKENFTLKVDAFVTKCELLRPDSTIIIGVSGGPDSLALLDYLMKRKEKDNLHIVVAHVDHMFRGEESKQDMEYVINYCKRLGIPCEATQIDVTHYQKENRLGTELAARECRYAFFKQIMRMYNGDYLALGHHGDDQVETILMRLVRGSTMKGYAGMQAKRKFAGGMLIRPLLVVTKDEISQYCQNQEIAVRFDSSNTEETYTRNRFRKHILPILKKENPNVHERFQSFSTYIQEDEKYLQELAFENMNKVLKYKEKNKVVLSIPLFESLPMPLQRRGIQLILNYLYNYQLPVTLSSVHTEQALCFIKRIHPSGSLDFPAGLKVIRTYEDCSFGFPEDQHLPYSYTLPIPGFVTLPNGDELIAEITNSFPASIHSNLFIGASKDIAGPLTVRSRIEGDRMTVKGMNGTKKIKTIFIEGKVPKLNRVEWPIVCDAKGNILWVPRLKYANTALSAELSNEDKYILIRYKSKESSRRINK